MNSSWFQVLITFAISGAIGGLFKMYILFYNNVIKTVLARMFQHNPSKGNSAGVFGYSSASTILLAHVLGMIGGICGAVAVLFLMLTLRRSPLTDERKETNAPADEHKEPASRAKAFQDDTVLEMVVYSFIGGFVGSALLESVVRKSFLPELLDVKKEVGEIRTTMEAKEQEFHEKLLSDHLNSAVMLGQMILQEHKAGTRGTDKFEERQREETAKRQLQDAISEARDQIQNRTISAQTIKNIRQAIITLSRMNDELARRRDEAIKIVTDGLNILDSIDKQLQSGEVIEWLKRHRADMLYQRAFLTQDNPVKAAEDLRESFDLKPENAAAALADDDFAEEIRKTELFKNIKAAVKPQAAIILAEKAKVQTTTESEKTKPQPVADPAAKG